VERVSRVGTARALVLLGSAVLLAASGVVCFVVLVFGPVLRERYGLAGPTVLGVLVFVLLVLGTIGAGNLVALRGRRTRAVVLGGCGTLVAGAVVAVGVLLLIVSG
jgi:hypothetical protein